MPRSSAVRRSHPTPLIGSLLLGTWLLACAPEASDAPDPPDAAQDRPAAPLAGDVQPVVEAFYAALGAFDLVGLDTLVTPDFEIVDGGRRMDTAGFGSFITDLRDEGLEFDFALSDWSIRLEGTVAYTLVTSVNRPVEATFHESAILLWDGDAWRIDRFHSTPAR